MRQPRHHLARCEGQSHSLHVLRRAWQAPASHGAAHAHAQRSVHAHAAHAPSAGLQQPAGDRRRRICRRARFGGQIAFAGQRPHSGRRSLSGGADPRGPRTRKCLRRVGSAIALDGCRQHGRRARERAPVRRDAAAAEGNRAAQRRAGRDQQRAAGRGGGAGLPVHRQCSGRKAPRGLQGARPVHLVVGGRQRAHSSRLQLLPAWRRAAGTALSAVRSGAGDRARVARGRRGRRRQLGRAGRAGHLQHSRHAAEPVGRDGAHRGRPARAGLRGTGRPRPSACLRRVRGEAAHHGGGVDGRGAGERPPFRRDPASAEGDASAARGNRPPCRTSAATCRRRSTWPP